MEKNQKILIIDKDNNQIDICKCFLNEIYKDIFTANNGQTGLELLKKNNIDLVFVDIDMPIINGFEFIEIAKRTHPYVNYIIMSDEVSILMLHRAIKVGVFDYLEKPFSRTTLIEKADCSYNHKQHSSHSNSLKMIISEINHEKSIERKAILIDLKEEISSAFKSANGNFNVAKFDIETLMESKVHSDQIELIKFLTPAERKISEMLDAGLSAKAIARKTDRSLNTIQVHIRSIRKKLGLTKSNSSIDIELEV